jgi:hypothetical protein
MGFGSAWPYAVYSLYTELKVLKLMTCCDSLDIAFETILYLDENA